MLKGSSQIEFMGYTDTSDDNYRGMMLEKMLSFAAGCYLSSELWRKVSKELLLQFGLTTDDYEPLDNFLYMLFDEGPSLSFEEAFTMGQKDGKVYEFSWLLPRLEPVARAFWERAVIETRKFKETYGHYFESAFDANFYAPAYAAVAACDTAGLPLDKWAGLWPGEVFEAFLYLVPEEDEECSEEPSKMEVKVTLRQAV